MYRKDFFETLLTTVERAERRARLKGVQLPLTPGAAQAYRATSTNGSLVLCDRHLDLRRGSEPWALTGEAFPVALCDDCEDDMERGRR